MIIRYLDYYLEPLQVASHLADQPDFAFLDSSDHQHENAHYSLIALEPFLKFSCHKGQWHMSFLSNINRDLSHIDRDLIDHITLINKEDLSPQRGDDLLSPDWINQLRANSKRDPFGTLRELLNRFRLPLSIHGSPDSILPLGAAIGYISYDLGASLESNIPYLLQGFEDWPEMEWRFYDTLMIFQHRQRIVTLVSTGFPFSGTKQEQWAHERFSHFLSLLEKIPPNQDEKNLEKNLEENIEGISLIANPYQMWSNPADLLINISEKGASEKDAFGKDAFGKMDLCSNFTSSAYQQAVRTIKEYIAQGDVYQVNLSQQFSSETTEPGYDLYRRIRQINRVPYGGYLRFDQREILCFSMERFLRMEGESVQTRPIKGTLPRGQTPQEDIIQAGQLMQSEKDRAELLMVVDMERNDLGKVCACHSIRVDQLFEVEKFATVFHLVSTVSGRLRPEFDHLDCLRACFPGGSITGTPKIKAMEIIAELEKVRRGVYCGALGYFGFNQISDFNIPIRTILKQGPKLWFNAGGGVVADSDPYLEYMETLHKVRSFLTCLQG